MIIDIWKHQGPCEDVKVAGLPNVLQSYHPRKGVAWTARTDKLRTVHPDHKTAKWYIVMFPLGDNGAPGGSWSDLAKYLMEGKAGTVRMLFEPKPKGSVKFLEAVHIPPHEHISPDWKLKSWIIEMKNGKINGKFRPKIFVDKLQWVARHDIIDGTKTIPEGTTHNSEWTWA